MHVITVTIGRNYSTGPAVFQSMRGLPMSLTMWEQFKEDVQADLLQAVPSDIVEVHYGTGMWDGVEEESCKITVLRHAKPTPDMLDDLHRLMAENARHYGQDSIAVTVGESVLV